MEVIVFIFVMCCIFLRIYFETVFEKIKIKIKPKNKPKLSDPIYNLDKYRYQDYYTIEKYEIALTTNFIPTFIAMFLIYPIYFYKWEYKSVSNIYLINMSDEEVIKLTKNDFINMFDNIENEEKIKKENQNKIENEVLNFNKEFEENYNKLN